jgi:purine-binding chemotaxis protein CheW
MPEEQLSECEIEEVEKDQYLVFSIESQEYGIQAMKVQEISRLLPMTKIPNAPPYIEGIMNLRGKLGSVINFRRKFKFADLPPDEDTRLIIIERANFPTGIIVDTVQEVIRISEESVQAMPESSKNTIVEDYVTGVGMLENRLIILLDINMVHDTDIGETETIKKAISEIQNMKTDIPEKKENKGDTSMAAQGIKGLKGKEQNARELTVKTKRRRSKTED